MNINGVEKIVGWVDMLDSRTPKVRVIWKDPTQKETGFIPLSKLSDLLETEKKPATTG